MMDFPINENFPTFPLFRVGKYPTPDEWQLETFKLTEKQKELIMKVASIKGIIWVLGSFHGEITVAISPVFGWRDILRELRRIFEELDYGHLEHHEAEDWSEPEKILIKDDHEGVFFYVAKELGKTDDTEYKRWQWENEVRLECKGTPRAGYEFAKKIFLDIFNEEECGYVRITPYYIFIGKVRNGIIMGNWQKHPEEKIRKTKEMLEEFLQAE